MNTGGTDGGKKIGVVGPAWDDGDGKMFRHAGAAGGAEVDAEIKAIWIEGFF